MSRANAGSGHLDIPVQQDADRFPYPVRTLPGPPSIDVVQQRNRRPAGDPSLDSMMPPPIAQDGRMRLPRDASDIGTFTIRLAPLLDEFWQRALNMTTADYYSPSMVIVPADKADGVGCPVSADRYIPARSLAYCVTDATIYAYEPFLQDEKLAGANWRSRDFAIVAAIAHEWGHHIQIITNLIPISEIIAINQPEMAPLASRQIELQADCYAGLFTRYSRDRGWLNAGDVDEAAEAMIRVGDEHVNEFGHHGLPEQRKEWFMRGYVHYAFRACDPW
jgi:predicted metalloprotease